MDLAQVDKLSSWISNTKFFIVCVDVFSRFVRVQPMKNAYAETTRAAFIRMCSDQGNNLIFPRKLWVDGGKQFSGDFRGFCENVGVHIYHTFSEMKACFAERAIRSLNFQICKYLEERRTGCYLPKLQNFTKTLNARVNICPQNTTASFTNFLPDQINLGGEWEVALTEILFPIETF